MLHCPSPRRVGTLITALPDGEVLRLFPEPAARLAAEDVYADASFPRVDKAAKPYVVINMVSSIDGKATSGGKASSIGSAMDHTIMRTLRSQADAVMIGSGTLRAEKLTLTVPENLARTRRAHGLNPQPLAVIPTTSGDLPLQENLLGYSPETLLILASSEIPKERLANLSSLARIEVVAPNETAMPTPGIDLIRALETLKERYAVDVLLVEGGPYLNHALVRMGLADELFLTLAPKILGGKRPEVATIIEGPPLLSHQETKPEVVTVHLSESELLLRYALRPRYDSS